MALETKRLPKPGREPNTSSLISRTQPAIENFILWTSQRSSLQVIICFERISEELSLAWCRLRGVQASSSLGRSPNSHGPGGSEFDCCVAKYPSTSFRFHFHLQNSPAPRIISVFCKAAQPKGMLLRVNHDNGPAQPSQAKVAEL